MNSGNYLVGAIANQWIDKLTYVFPTDPNPPVLSGVMPWVEKLRSLGLDADRDRFEVSDLPAWVFRDGCPEGRIIELKSYSVEGYGSYSSAPIAYESAIPFDAVAAYQFNDRGFTHMIVAQSPAYTPSTADHLLSIIGEYFVAV